MNVRGQVSGYLLHRNEYQAYKHATQDEVGRVNRAIEEWPGKKWVDRDVNHHWRQVSDAYQQAEFNRTKIARLQTQLQPVRDEGGERDRREEVGGEFVIARGDTAEVL